MSVSDSRIKSGGGMGTKELREKYEATGTPQAINKAIRAELAGGPECLDGLAEVNRLARSTGSPEAGAAVNALRAVKDAMEAEIRRRYEMPAQQ